MGTTLTGKNISASYLGLLKTTDNAVIGGTAKIITDGNGNDSPLYLSTSAVGIGIASPTLKLEVSGNAEIDGINIGKGNNSITTNTAIGVNALNVNSALGNLNTAVGYSAMASNTDGEQNVAIGAQALLSNTTGDQNVAIGDDSLKQNTTGEKNTAIGKTALFSNTTGSNNTAIGRLTLDSNTIGERNVALGNQTLNDNISGDHNVGLGYDSLTNLASGHGNIGIGYEAGSVLITGSNNIIIGKDAEVNAGSSTNEIVIGYNVTGNGSNTVTIGNSSITANHFSGNIILSGNAYLTSGNFVHFDNGGSNDYAIRKQGTTLEFRTGGTYNFLSGNSTFAGNIRTSGNILLDEDRIIARNTSDGSDNGYIAVVGGGAESDGRGAIIRLYGNENAENGRLAISTGNNASSFMDFRVAGSERMRLDSSGNVGIGSTSPSGKLEVNLGGSFAYFTRTAGDDGSTDPAIALGTDSTKTRLYSYGTAMTFFTGAVGGTASERMRLDSSGRVGINCTPSNLVEINGGTGVSTTGVLVVRQSADTSGGGISITSSNAVSHRIFKDANGKLNIGSSSNPSSFVQDISGNVGIGTTSPDVAGFPSSTLTIEGSSTNYGAFELGSASQTSANGRLGEIRFYNKESANPYGFASIRGLRGSSAGDSIISFFTSSSNTGAERMRLDSSGNVGIGLTPSYRLHVNSGTDGISGGIAGSTYGIRFDNGGTFSSNKSTIHGVDDTLVATYQPLMLNASILTFGINANEKMRLDSSGNVGIGGTNNGNSRLSVHGAGIDNIGGTANSLRFRFYNGTTFQSGMQAVLNTNEMIVGAVSGDMAIRSQSNMLFATGGNTERMRISSNGEVRVNVQSQQTESPLVSRENGSSIEFGHLNQTSGYYGTVGSMYNNGTPFISFSCDSSSTSAGNNFATRGFKGNVIHGGTSGELMFSQATDANNTSQSLTERMRLDSSGRLGIGLTPTTVNLEVKSIQDSSFDEGIGVVRSNSSQTGYINMVGGAMNINAPNAIPIKFRDGGNTNLTIGGDGNVGIGESSPVKLLTVGADSASAQIAVKRTNTNTTGAFGAYSFHNSDDDVVASIMGFGDGGNVGSHITFGTTTNTSGSNPYSDISERMRITSGGDVHISRTTDDQTTDGISLNERGLLRAVRTDADCAIFHRLGTDGDVVLFRKGSTTVGSVSITTTATTYNTSSDYRLKEDLQDFNALEIASKIKMYDFKWKENDSRSYGVMAHELEEVLPQAVTGEKDAEEMQSVDYSKLVPILLKSIQELKAEIDELKKNK